MAESIKEYLRKIGSKGGKRRWVGTTPKERKLAASQAGQAAWAKLTPEQRSAEMKRRAKVRKRNQEKE